MTESDSDDESGREMSKNTGNESNKVPQSQPPLTSLPQEMAEVLNVFVLSYICLIEWVMC